MSDILVRSVSAINEAYQVQLRRILGRHDGPLGEKLVRLIEVLNLMVERLKQFENGVKKIGAAELAELSLYEEDEKRKDGRIDIPEHTKLRDENACLRRLLAANEEELKMRAAKQQAEVENLEKRITTIAQYLKKF